MLWFTISNRLHVSQIDDGKNKHETKNNEKLFTNERRENKKQPEMKITKEQNSQIQYNCRVRTQYR